MTDININVNAVRPEKTPTGIEVIELELKYLFIFAIIKIILYTQ